MRNPAAASAVTTSPRVWVHRSLTGRGDGALAVRVRPLVLVAAGATDEVPPAAEPLRLQRDVDGVPVRQVDESQCRRLAAICSARVTGRTGTTGRRAPGPQAGVPPLARARYSSRRRRL